MFQKQYLNLYYEFEHQNKEYPNFCLINIMIPNFQNQAQRDFHPILGSTYFTIYI